MWTFFVLFSMMFMAIVGSVFLDYSSKSPTPPTNAEVTASIGAFNAFSKGALLYTQVNGTPNGAVNWDIIKTTAGLPDAFKNLDFGSYWKIVPDGKGSYLVCAEMPADSVPAVAKMLPQLTSFARTKNSLEMQVFATNSTEADEGADLCK